MLLHVNIAFISLVRVHALLLPCNGGVLRAYALLFPNWNYVEGLCLDGTTCIMLLSVSLHFIINELMLYDVNDYLCCEVLCGV